MAHVDIDRPLNRLDDLELSVSDGAAAAGVVVPSGEYASHYTDSGNGARFARMHAESFRYDVDREIWLVWDSHRWVNANTGELLRAGKAVAEKMLHDAAKIQDEDVRERAMKFALRSFDAGKLEAMIKMASSEASLEAGYADFDRDAHLFNCANGTVDLRTGQLLAHDREHLITKISPIAYEPRAKAPRWERFIAEVFDQRPQLMAYVQRFAGYSLSGDTREQCFALAYGTGANGKGRLLRALRRVAGDYGVTADIATFLAGKQRGGGDAAPDLASLAGARFVTAGEADKGVRLSEGLIKTLTGDDPVTCRNLYEKPFTYLPAFKLWMHVNHKPVVRGTDDGIWRRVHMIPFSVSFKGREDKALDAKLEEELPGILAWAVRGAVQRYANGLGESPEVRAATESYRAESDVLALFIADQLAVVPSGEITRKRLTELYTAWCTTNGEEPWRPATLYQRLAERNGIVQAKDGDGKRGFRGIKEATNGATRAEEK